MNSFNSHIAYEVHSITIPIFFFFYSEAAPLKMFHMVKIYKYMCTFYILYVDMD